MTLPKRGRRRTDNPGPARHNLPERHAPLIGREQDSAAVRDLVLQAPGRLVTLTGSGGCGKTQLALLVAAGLVDTFPDGVFLVDLAPVQTPELVLYTVAAVLGCRQRAGETLLESLLAYLKTAELLLVLDNCDHLIEPCATLAERVLGACPKVRLLATSRERLRNTGEATFGVPPLATPEPDARLAPAELLAYPAVRLFVERARTVRPEFRLEAAEVTSIIGICARLEGLPLALELAAARVAVLSVSQILERLDNSVRLLVGGSRTAAGRQQTLRATLDWSHGLLTAPEQVVFRRLATFRGSWTLEAAEAVCGDALAPATDVLDVLTQLIDKSLVVVLDQRDRRARYRLLEPIRQYAQEHLLESHEVDAVRERQAQYFIAFADALERDASVGGARRQAAVDALLLDYRNLQAALHWAIETRNPVVGLQLAWALQLVWKFHIPLEEGQMWTAAVLALPGADAPTPARAVSLLTAAMLAWMQGDHPAAQHLYAEALPLARQLGDPWIQFVALVDSGMEAEQRRDYTTARARWEEGLVVTRASGDRASEAILLQCLARAEIFARNLPAARALYEEALRIARKIQDTWIMTIVLDGLGAVVLAERDSQRARMLINECLRLKPAPMWRKSAMLTLVQVDLVEGAYDDAREHLSEALALAKTVGHRGNTVQVLDAVAGVMVALRGNPRMVRRLAALVDANWDSQELDWVSTVKRDQLRSILGYAGRAEDAADAQALSLDEAVALAEAELQQATLASGPRPADTAGAPLTARQVEVAVLVGQGRTNRQIGQHLVITERAAAAHVEHILDKLGVSSRAQIAVWTSERGLLTPRSV